jgi:hypothetical protein
MSEYRRSEPVEAVEVPPSEPLISMADILKGIGWLAYHGTSFVAKCAVEGSILAYKGARAVTKAIQESRAMSLSEANTVVQQSENAQEAIRHLAALPGFEIPQAHAQQWKTRVEALAATNDKLGVETLARDIIRARQDRMQATLLTLAADSCREIGFNAVPLKGSHGILIAKASDGRRTIKVEVDKTKEGDVELQFDAEHFHGGACIEALNALHKSMEARGVRFRVASRQRKDRQPVFDGRRIAQVVRARSGV